MVVVQRRGQICLYFSLVSCLLRTNTLSISLLHLQCTPTFCNHFHHSRQIRLHFESCFVVVVQVQSFYFFIRVWTLGLAERMMDTMFTTKRGEEKAAQRMLFTDQARMSIAMYMEMIWRNWFQQAGKFPVLSPRKHRLFCL